jgi:uncharacterized membrane protein YfcA
MIPLLALTLVCTVTYSFEIVFGLAGTVLMLPLLSFFYDAKTLVVYSVLPQALVASIGLLRSPRTVEARVILPILATAAVGMAAGLWLFYAVSLDLFRMLLAAAITAVGVYLIIAPHRLRLPSPFARTLDFLAGLSQGLFGISGPIAMTRLLATFENKTVVRNYALAFFLPLNLARGAGYLLHHTYTAEIGRMMIVSAPFLAIALWFSNRLHFRVHDAWFRRVVAWFVLLGGLSLFHR